MGEIKTFVDLNAWRESHDILPALKSGVSLQRRMTYQRSIHLRSKLRSVLECCYKLVLLIYKLTNKFPAKEDYALTSQMRRASVSVSSNIAEGFSRRGNKEKIMFYSMSLGSITELQSQLLVAKDVGYIGDEEYKLVVDQTIVAHKLVNGLIKGVARLHNT